MPTYEYYCESCDIIVEDFVTVSKRKEEVECPVCHSVARRAFTTGPGLPYRDPAEYGGHYICRRNKANIDWKRFHDDGDYNCKVCEQVIGKGRNDIGELGHWWTGNPNAKSAQKRIQVSGYNPGKPEKQSQAGIIVSRC